MDLSSLFFPIFTFVILFFSCASPKSAFEIQQEHSHAPATVRFKNLSTNALMYLWDFGDGTMSDLPEPEHRYILSGKYLVKLKASNQKKVHTSESEIIVEAPHHCLLEMKTTEGSMTILLYDDTPLHRDNFISLAESGYYEGLLFHRVINGFMIQGGDPESKDAPAGKRLGGGGPGYTIPAEIVDTLVHIKGALAAARTGDAVNPQKASSGSQFYIVHGKPVASAQLDGFEIQKGIKYSEKDRTVMINDGGTPFLDKEYTVFGRVVKGLDVIDKIASVRTSPGDRPETDVKILSINVVR